MTPGLFRATPGPSVPAVLLAGLRIDRHPTRWQVRQVGGDHGVHVAGVGQAEALREFHSRGTKSVGLGVDAENPTGALRVAEAAGGTVVQRFTTFERELLREAGTVTLLRGAARRVRDVARPARA